ncbi:MAG TPA: arginine--tRNA ligase [Candidatus Copromorpha excrementipullorum]|uniref:Arginine--tRNA ligase n=1 Tax=Candidatus Allocopromorpha excrementipullorum TaxID=2840743 RepID=A0A9D1SVF5_9FIRM|nr:arginine--tRNA ligase [Candidatus Copromorpha excrementipullorum]
MINYREKIADILAPHIEGLERDEILPMIEVPADSSKGDYAFPCFKLAKIMRKAPPMIAKGIAEAIEGEKMFQKVESVNAYVNMFMSKAEFADNVVKEVIEKDEDFGRSDIGAGRTVIVEYSSPNIAKPFHIGHIRSTVIGNSIYKIYDFLGYDTIRINHLGDYGTQFGKMICAYRKWGNKEDVIREPIKSLLSYYTKFHEEAEKDPSLEDEARAIFVRLENGEPEEVELWQWFRDESLREFNRVYDMLGITFDSYNGESFYSDKMPAVVQELKDKSLLVEDNGAQIVKLDQFDLPPALITKSDGSTLYITRDIAAAIYRKNTYDFYKNIYVVASQQNLHFQQWKKVIGLMGYDWADDCVHVPFGLVSMEEGTMSTRQGRVIFLEDVLNRAVEQTRKIIMEKNVNTENVDETAREVGIGAVIFNELSNYRIKDYVFSWDKVLNFEGETGPYVQYTHARACSILRNAGEAVMASAKEGFDASRITSDSAHALIKLIYEMPEVIAEAGEKYEPSIVTRHIVDIAQAFNKFYHDEHILVDDKTEKTAKVALVMAARNVIRNGLDLLGMKAPEKM